MAKMTISSKKTIPKKARASALRVVIDYPQVHEIVLPGHYSIRLTAAGAKQAQVRLDGAEWLDCHESLGHFWRDWAPQAGQTRIESRARIGKGRWSATQERTVIVKPNEASFVG
ncbi:MAG: hypothetical protein AAB268_14020 [Elusimicrobiota bacterium]